MPRIDPLQLLKCLSVLLSPTGGIKSKEEVQRLASLMTKFSKKLVSKCIYIQILKTTKTDLLGMFMAAGGWNLTHTWLSDAIVAKNWPLIQELLELLLMCPVDVERLKTNNCPKLIKGLSKESSNESVKLLASKLVEQWLKIVKGETEAVRAHQIANAENKAVEVARADNRVPTPDSVSVTVTVKEEGSRVEPANQRLQASSSVSEETKVDVQKAPAVSPPPPPSQSAAPLQPVKQEPVQQIKSENLEPKVEVQKLVIKSEDGSDESNEDASTWDAPIGQLPVYRITIRDGKQVLAKVFAGEKSNKKLSADNSNVTSVAESVKTLSKCSVLVPKVNDAILKKEELKKEAEELPTKISADSQRSPVAKSKIKSEKPETNSDGTKTSKEVQKKSKDVQQNTKAPDKDKKSKVESSKEKSKEKDTSKEKNKEKLKEKDNGKERENNKIKDRKTSTEKSNAQSEKDKAALAKLIPPAISKLGKIPKKSKPEEMKSNTDVKKPSPNEEVKKPSSEDVKKVSNEEVKKPEIRRPPIPDLPTSRKPSMSIESRKSTDAARPKTVKTFNSKFRSTGLEEEAKPPPARPIKKPIMPIEKKPVKLPSLKRPSPPKELSTPPEKKLKPTIADAANDDAKKNEKTGGIKLIPPRPKPSFLQESDMFMDALTASTKKEPRKRKRRTSSSKDGPDAKKELATGKEDDLSTESTQPGSPTSEDNKSPPIVRPLLRFYQETLGTNDEDKEGDEDMKENEKNGDKDVSETKAKSEEQDQKSSEDGEEDSPKDTAEGIEENKRRSSKDDSTNEKEGSDDAKENDSTDEMAGRYPRGVLIYHKTKKGPKKMVRWKPEKDLETIKYFELDETERVNVTKNFTDMKQIERSNEREAFLLARKIPQDDVMEEKTTWQALIPIDLPPSLVEPGARSREKDVQYAREKVILQALYFNRSMIPDTAAEPELEIHPTTDPVIIPLDDVTGNPDSVNDFQNTPWPEPKPILIPQSPPPQFQQPQPSFGSYPSQSFPGPQIYPNQPSMPNPMPIQGGMMIPNSMNNMNPMGGINNMGAGGDWRTGDGKVLPVNDMPMQMDMYNQGGPPMGMGMTGMGGMGGPAPDMNYNMMGGEEMGPGVPYGPQRFPMGGPHPGMYPPYRGGRGHNMGGGMRSGRAGSNQMGPRGPGGGPWYRGNGPIMGNNWQGGGGGGSGGGANAGGGGRGGRNWTGQNRTVCKHFVNGSCWNAEKCPFLHPGVNGPQY
ncbi:serine/threonine-protein phosphatase 1 regulatory subunit 10 isoform X2 [Periplaneta americana]|uniref:serine/threonine-protein phosphatase 1 regulatory subunit 10 isoform X2 n=1 Tax=Periplaneta americana TaxID=6978 RepID=UPI0037E749D1